MVVAYKRCYLNSVYYGHRTFPPPFGHASVLIRKQADQTQKKRRRNVTLGLELLLLLCVVVVLMYRRRMPSSHNNCWVCRDQLERLNQPVSLVSPPCHACLCCQPLVPMSESWSRRTDLKSCSPPYPVCFSSWRDLVFFFF